MKGKIFITRKGYDPLLGKHVKDPYLGETPTLGACRPDIRKHLTPGDHIFVISGMIPNAKQFVMGGFEIDRKIDAREAYHLFPDLRLSLREDGQPTGNILVDAGGKQHPLDDHKHFDRRKANYVVGKNLIALNDNYEIQLGREQTLDALCEIFNKPGRKPIDIVGRFGKNLTEKEIIHLREWLTKIKTSNN